MHFIGTGGSSFSTGVNRVLPRSDWFHWVKVPLPGDPLCARVGSSARSLGLLARTCRTDDWAHTSSGLFFFY